MYKIFIATTCVLTLMSCGKTSKSTPDVHELLESMKGMTVEERGKAFAENIVKYMDAKDSASMVTLQDSTYAWACTLYEADKVVFEKAVKEVYRNTVGKRKKNINE